MRTKTKPVLAMIIALSLIFGITALGLAQRDVQPAVASTPTVEVTINLAGGMLHNYNNGETDTSTPASVTRNVPIGRHVLTTDFVRRHLFQPSGVPILAVEEDTGVFRAANVARAEGSGYEPGNNVRDLQAHQIYETALLMGLDDGSTEFRIGDAVNFRAGMTLTCVYDPNDMVYGRSWGNNPGHMGVYLEQRFNVALRRPYRGGLPMYLDTPGIAGNPTVPPWDVTDLIEFDARDLTPLFHTVNAIGRDAFNLWGYWNDNVPGEFSFIGGEGGADYRDSIVSIELPRTVDHIGQGAFNQNRKLESLTGLENLRVLVGGNNDNHYSSGQNDLTQLTVGKGSLTRNDIRDLRNSLTGDPDNGNRTGEGYLGSDAFRTGSLRVTQDNFNMIFDVSRRWEGGSPVDPNVAMNANWVHIEGATFSNPRMALYVFSNGVGGYNNNPGNLQGPNPTESVFSRGNFINTVSSLSGVGIPIRQFNAAVFDLNGAAGFIPTQYQDNGAVSVMEGGLERNIHNDGISGQVARNPAARQLSRLHLTKPALEPYLPHHTFAGWREVRINGNAVNNGHIWTDDDWGANDGVSRILTGETVLRAEFIPIVYDIDYEGLESGDTNDPRNLTTFNVSQLPKTIYNAAGANGQVGLWFTEPDGDGEHITEINLSNFERLLDNGDIITLYVDWQPPAEVTFRFGSAPPLVTDLDPGSFDMHSQTIVEESADGFAFDGDIPVIPAFVDGHLYRFAGWFTGDGTSGDWGDEWNFEEDVLDGNITLFAKYDRVTYHTVTFMHGVNDIITPDADNTPGDDNTPVGSGSTFVEDGTRIPSARVPAPVVPTHFVFTGWFTDDGDTDWGDQWIIATDLVDGDMTLYARIDPRVYYIVFEIRGGVFAGAGNTPIDSEVFLTTGIRTGVVTLLPAPTREGFIFEGWFIAGNHAAGAQTQVAAGRTSNIRFEAVWTPVVPPAPPRPDPNEGPPREWNTPPALANSPGDGVIQE